MIRRPRGLIKGRKILCGGILDASSFPYARSPARCMPGRFCLIIEPNLKYLLSAAYFIADESSLCPFHRASVRTFVGVSTRPSLRG